jgi:hypothetical protein
MPSPTQPRPALPPAAVDRLFARFAAIFGAQKMAGAWGNVDVAERNATGAQHMARIRAMLAGSVKRMPVDDGAA